MFDSAGRAQGPMLVACCDKEIAQALLTVLTERAQYKSHNEVVFNHFAVTSDPRKAFVDIRNHTAAEGAYYCAFAEGFLQALKVVRF